MQCTWELKDLEDVAYPGNYEGPYYARQVGKALSGHVYFRRPIGRTAVQPSDLAAMSFALGRLGVKPVAGLEMRYLSWLLKSPQLRG